MCECRSLAGEGGEAAQAAERGEGYLRRITPHPVLAFGSDHPLPQGERGSAPAAPLWQHPTSEEQREQQVLRFISPSWRLVELLREPRHERLVGEIEAERCH